LDTSDGERRFGVKQWELRGVTVGVDDDGPSPRTGESLEPLRILVNQVPALFWTTDAELVITSSLGAEFERLGIGPNQLVGTALTQLFEVEAHGGLIGAHQRALEGSSVRFEATWSRRSFRARVAPLRDSADQVMGTICVALDDGEAATQTPQSHLLTTA
jgi:PAS domain-containing protein